MAPCIYYDLEYDYVEKFDVHSKIVSVGGELLQPVKVNWFVLLEWRHPEKTCLESSFFYHVKIDFTLDKIVI